MTIDVYGTEGCTQCHNLKQYLTSNDVKFVYHDVATDKEAIKKLRSLQVLQLPVTILNDNEVTSGFDISKIKEIVNGYKQSCR